MGSLKATLCAGTALLAALVPATAYAQNTGRVSVTPAHPAPGTDVTLRVPGCAERSAVAASAAFESAVRLSLTSSDGALVGAARIRASATAGAHEVEVRCGSQRREGRLTVTERPRRPESGRSEAPAAPVHASPVAPVDAGGGAAHRLAATGAGNGRAPQGESRPAGPGTAHAVTGLVLAGVAAVAVALRSARRSRGTD
ncbi:hypothetical protein J7I94_09530 [Streptomyces sp. ISL-12]|uniref:hypothetical protein n=1 Tax=Streptomyces sp. ISL-12 TaxID=2819177 RepID=UPI001BEB5AE6|nr:hypothetical protein [Streptomyces sp. ISL-12]MBT2410799.1 hypothetical protein [Streptomyces sp. ISL-12]